MLAALLAVGLVLVSVASVVIIPITVSIARKAVESCVASLLVHLKENARVGGEPAYIVEKRLAIMQNETDLKARKYSDLVQRLNGHGRIDPHSDAS